ncbi:hypothetical protein [Streptomyces cavernicola]|uniref:Sensor histidine kinase n=1 Tax=Streptomyces cavernicola TaxID=3043613 RepID=A0ABT6SK51_9ACTN|nr:hypothetical protein [Streptomyces sp. B-S-A6]MDI3408582.1 hypothetical protein [Streptomyces sp. B-S-A6]
MWYAQNSGRRVRQLLGDAAVLLWTGVWAAAATIVYRLAQLLTRPVTAPSAHGPGSSAGSGAGLGRFGRSAAELPLVGERLDAAMRGVAGAGDRFEGGRATVEVLTAGGAVLLFLLPVGLVLALWLPRRLRWVRQAAAAYELAASEDGRELLALRALMRPLDELSRTAQTLQDASPGSLAEGWREGDPETLDALADAELVRLGLRRA